MTDAPNTPEGPEGPEGPREDTDRRLARVRGLLDAVDAELEAQFADLERQEAAVVMAHPDGRAAFKAATLGALAVMCEAHPDQEALAEAMARAGAAGSPHFGTRPVSGDPDRFHVYLLPDGPDGAEFPLGTISVRALVQAALDAMQRARAQLN